MPPDGSPSSRRSCGPRAGHPGQPTTASIRWRQRTFNQSWWTRRTGAQRVHELAQPERGGEDLPSRRGHPRRRAGRGRGGRAAARAQRQVVIVEFADGVPRRSCWPSPPYSPWSSGQAAPTSSRSREHRPGDQRCCRSHRAPAEVEEAPLRKSSCASTPTAAPDHFRHALRR